MSGTPVIRRNPADPSKLFSLTLQTFRAHYSRYSCDNLTITQHDTG